MKEELERVVQLQPIVAAFGGAIIASVLGAIVFGLVLR